MALKSKCYMITHIFREGNAVADSIANERFLLSDFTWWYSIPDAAMEAYLRNLEIRIEYRVR